MLLVVLFLALLSDVSPKYCIRSTASQGLIVNTCEMFGNCNQNKVFFRKNNGFLSIFLVLLHVPFVIITHNLENKLHVGEF